MAGRGTAHLRPELDAALRVTDLNVKFASRAGMVHAVSGVSFDVMPGETVGLVGESGCGKSSTGRAIVQLPSPTSGSVMIHETELTSMNAAALRVARRRVQLVFQDPVGSLNPRRRVRDIVRRALDTDSLTAIERAERVDAMLRRVGLDPATVGDKWPHELSGGQCQRVSIARALAVEPEVLICDEPVSALDVSVQAQVLNLLRSLRSDGGLAMVFISHDIAAVANISDRIAVMYLGKICEVANTKDLLDGPAHPYTRLLIDHVPRGTNVAAHVVGEIPSPTAPPPGCVFHTRCERATNECRRDEPQMRQIANAHFVACHIPITRPTL